MKIVSSVLILFLFFTGAFANSAVDLRNQFDEACTNETKANQFLKSLNEKETEDLIIQGYSGAIESVLARFSSNPLYKYKCCKNGLNRLNKAVSKKPQSLELRYLRMLIEYNVPAFLNMSGHMEEDKKEILKLIRQSTDHDLNQRVSSFLLEKNLCSAEDKEWLKSKNLN